MPEGEVCLSLLSTETDIKVEDPIMRKIRQSSIAPIQEMKPFLCKGTGIGPGAGPGIAKLKAEAVKSSDKDVPGTPTRISDEEAHASARSVMDTSDGECIPVEAPVADASLSFYKEEEKGKAQTLELSDVDVTHNSDGGFFAVCKDAKATELLKDDKLPHVERGCHIVSFPMEFGTNERHDSKFASEPDSVPHTPWDEAGGKGVPSATLSQLLSESTGQVVHIASSASGSASFRANLASEEQYAPRVSPMKATSLASSSLKRLGAVIPDYFSPSDATLVQSPIGSLASRDSSRVQYSSDTDLTHSQKNLGSSQKSVVVIAPPKEPARGFKRLLKFGRKSRETPNIIVRDGVFASAPSKGDDELEEVNKEANKHSSNIILQKLKLQERLIKDYGSGSHASNTDIGPDLSVQSSIVPSNFKLQYDHARGSTKFKGTRDHVNLHDKFKSLYSFEELESKAAAKAKQRNAGSFWDTVMDAKVGSFKFGF